jgi:hypothetical protein
MSIAFQHGGAGWMEMKCLYFTGIGEKFSPDGYE